MTSLSDNSLWDCLLCVQAQKAVKNTLSTFLSLHDCLRGLGTILKQLIGVSLEEVPMLPGELH